MPHATLVLVRHGETEWSRTGRHTSRTDLPLEPNGEAQARALAPVLANWEFGQVLVSPRRRALETCRLAGFAGVAEVTEDLAEWDYGEYEGRTTAEIREQRPDWTLWEHGVPGGETAADVGRRTDVVIELVRAHEGPTLCFAHGHVLRVLAARWVGIPPIGGRLWALDAGTVSELGWERETPVIARWNEPPPPAP